MVHLLPQVRSVMYGTHDIVKIFEICDLQHSVRSWVSVEVLAGQLAPALDRRRALARAAGLVAGRAPGSADVGGAAKYRRGSAGPARLGREKSPSRRRGGAFLPPARRL